MRRLVWAVDGKIEVGALSLGEGSELDVELSQMSPGDLLIKLFGEHMDPERECLGVRPQGDLSEDLVGERARHNEGWVSSGTSKVDKTAFCKEEDVTAAWHGVAVNLGLDIDNLLSIGLEPCDVDFNVKVANVADDGILWHMRKVGTGDDIAIASGGDEDIRPRSSILHSGHLIAGHGGLEGVNRVNLGDKHASTIGTQ